MARRVYLHIGTMKSATSYIQALFELNDERLDAFGVRWLPVELGYPAVRELFGRRLQPTDQTGAWATAARRMRQHPGDVVLSNELLAPINVGHVRRLLKALPSDAPHVIITVRDLARVMPSHWQTTLKNGRSQTWSAFASDVCVDAAAIDRPEQAETFEWFWQRHDVAAMIARWEQFVPAERITVVTVPPQGGEPRSVGRRFGSVIGVDVTEFAEPEVLSNPSMGAHSAELMRRINSTMTREQIAERRFGFRLAFGGDAVTGRAHLEPKFALSPEQHDWVRHRAAVMVEEIKRSGVGVAGDLSDLIPSREPVSDAVDPSDTSDADLLEAAAEALQGMAKVTADMRRETYDLTAEVATLGAENERLTRRIGQLQKRIEKLGTGQRREVAETSPMQALVRRLRRPWATRK